MISLQLQCGALKFLLFVLLLLSLSVTRAQEPGEHYTKVEMYVRALISAFQDCYRDEEFAD